jgi:hypothetical protein
MEVPLGSLRLGFITLNPAAFERESLFYRTHNGGRQPETFPLAGTTVDHGEAVSFLVSARQGLGLTGGVVELGDARRILRVEVDKAAAALVGLITYREVGDTYFCRLALSAGEVDETRRLDLKAGEKARPPFRIALSGGWSKEQGRGPGVQGGEQGAQDNMHDDTRTRRVDR